jgi:hypothetical protein
MEPLVDFILLHTCHVIPPFVVMASWRFYTIGVFTRSGYIKETKGRVIPRMISSLLVMLLFFLHFSPWHDFPLAVSFFFFTHTIVTPC